MISFKQAWHEGMGGWWRIGKRLRQIKLLVLDVDGVLTDGGLLV